MQGISGVNSILGMSPQGPKTAVVCTGFAVRADSVEYPLVRFEFNHTGTDLELIFIV